METTNADPQAPEIPPKLLLQCVSLSLIATIAVGQFIPRAKFSSFGIQDAETKYQESVPTSKKVKPALAPSPFPKYYFEERIGKEGVSEEPKAEHNKKAHIRVGVTQSAPPSLDSNDSIPNLNKPEFDGLTDAPFQTLINILLPNNLVEVRLRLRVHERINATI